MPTDDPAVTPAARRAPRISWRVLLVVALCLALLVVPFTVGNFWLRVFTTTLMFAALGHAMQIMVGLAGWPALGNVVFFGVGAYASSLLYLRVGVPVVPAVLFGGVVAAAVSLVAARAMLSLRGSYFLMATVALNYAMLELTNVARDLTNGPQGVTLPSVVEGSPRDVYTVYYFAFLVVVAFSSVGLVLLRRSRLGFGLLALKGNEDAARMIGIPTFRYKSFAWAASAALTGVVGGIYAFWIGYIDPESVYDLLISLAVILMVLLGGRLLVLGPILAAFAYELVDVVAWRELDEARLAALGIALVAVVLFLPGGLPELIDHLRRVPTGRAPRPEAGDAA